MRHSTSRPKTQGHILVFSLAALGIGFVLFAANTSADTTGVLPSTRSALIRPALGPPQCTGGNCSISHTTVADFNPGNFYLTGMTKNSLGGGDGDGEVRLLTFGISTEDWNPSPYQDQSSRPFPSLFGHAAAQRNGVIFVSGGKINPNDLNPIDTVYTATIQSDHSLGTWQTSAITLPQRLWAHGMVVVSNTLVVIGGMAAGGNVPQSTVYTATINANGTIGSFQPAASLPAGRAEFGLAVISGTIYVIGGQAPSGISATNLVYYTTPDPATGAITQWYTATTQTPTAGDNPTGNIAKLTATSYNGRFYQIGGIDGSTYFPYIYFAQPSTGGDITSSFTQTLSLNNNIIFASSAAFAGQLYVIGGAINNNSTYTNTIYSAIISSTGHLNDSIGWAVSPVLSSARARAASVMSDDGWIYVLGGVTGSPGGSQSSLTSYDFGSTSGDHPASYTSSGDYTSPIIDVGGNYTVTNIAWNTTITTSQNMSLTLQYYCGNSPLTLVSCSAPSGANDGVRQTKNTTVNQQARYWQYTVNFTRGDVVDQSPILNWVRFDYNVPVYPDFTITGMQAPSAPASPMTQTITVWVLNQGDIGYSPAKSKSPTVVTPQPTSQFPPLPRKSSAPKVAAGSYISTTNYYFYVDVYVDPASPPSTVTDVPTTPCVNTRGVPNYKPWVYSGELPIGTTMAVEADCWVVPIGGGTPNVFYAQVDTCEDPSGNDCSTTYGRILEKNENNNIFGPIESGTTEGGLSQFLPFIKRSP